MPAPSSEFTLLEARVAALKEKFLDKQILCETTDPTAFNPDIEMIAAFKLLAHAEIEDYIEKKAKTWIGQKEAFVSTGAYRFIDILDLLPILQILKKPIPIELPFEKQKLTSVLLDSFKAAKELINDNNGIKSESFLKLSLLCGKPIDEIDCTISALLTQYGKTRGDVAHVSALRAQSLQAPTAEYNQVANILASLKTYFYS